MDWGSGRNLFFISAATSAVSPKTLSHQDLSSYHHSQPLSCGVCWTAWGEPGRWLSTRCPFSARPSAPSQGSFGPRHVNVLGLFFPPVKRAALPSLVGPWTHPIAVLQKCSPCSVCPVSSCPWKGPHQLQRTTETWVQAGPSVVMWAQ